MPFLIATVVLVGLLCLLDLVLTLGVVRRLREHTKLMDALYEIVDVTRALPPGAQGPAVGSIVDDFAASTVDGTAISRDGLPDDIVLAFLSPDCRGCQDQLPEVASWAGRTNRLLAVVNGRTADPSELVATLAPVAQVVVEDGAAPISEAFKVSSYPTFRLVGAGGRLKAAAGHITRL